MKIINKNNGYTIATGRFETSKISDIEIDTTACNGVWVIFRYCCDNLILRSGMYSCLSMVAEVSSTDNIFTVEASGCDYIKDTELRADVRLTADEREHLFAYIINRIVGTAAHATNAQYAI